MNCHAVQQALIEALYGNLPTATRRDVEAHWATCADCAQAWASLQALQQALGQWHDVAPPADLHARVLARVAAQRRAVPSVAWWRHGLVSTGLAVGTGLAMMVLTVLLLGHFLPLEAMDPQALLLCGALWGGAYIGLCRLALSAAAGTARDWEPGELPLAQAARVAVLAVGVTTLLLGLSTLLPLAALSGASGPAPWPTFLGGGAVALLAVGVSSGCLGRAAHARPLLHTLLAACCFVLAVAPGLWMFCVSFTLGGYVALLLVVGLGAGAGGVLGTTLHSYVSHARSAGI